MPVSSDIARFSASALATAAAAGSAPAGLGAAGLLLDSMTLCSTCDTGETGPAAGIVSASNSCEPAWLDPCSSSTCTHDTNNWCSFGNESSVCGPVPRARSAHAHSARKHMFVRQNSCTEHTCATLAPLSLKTPCSCRCRPGDTFSRLLVWLPSFLRKEGEEGRWRR